LLNDVVANYLGTLSETEFFSALAATLRANGFYDVQLTHGTAEHGKDFIAKRMESGLPTQYGIQTKVGDLGVPGFRAARNQIESIRLTTLSHPAFDPGLPRRGVLATTGRLTGQAPTEAQEYKRLQDSDTFRFDVWQISDLLKMMVDAPEVGLAGDADAPLLGAVAAVYEARFTESSLERLSSGWSEPTGDPERLWRAALSALVISHRLAQAGRRDLAALTGLHLVRAAWARAERVDASNKDVLGVADAGRGLFAFHAAVLFEEVASVPYPSPRLLNPRYGPGEYATYPVRCLRLLELFGLLGLCEQDLDRRTEITTLCAALIVDEPGASHPLSDHWAVCIPPAALLVRAENPELVARWLQEICVWVADHYATEGLGLAAPWSEPREEIVRAFGPALQHRGLLRRPESLVSSVLLDLAAAFEMEDTYDAVVNDVMATRIYPCVVECDDGPGLYRDGLGGVYLEPWVRYDGHFADHAGWQSSPPHRRAASFTVARMGRAWDLLAICSVMRDRCFPTLLRQLAALGA
jgi:hypothetical protein